MPEEAILAVAEWRGTRGRPRHRTDLLSRCLRGTVFLTAHAQEPEPFHIHFTHTSWPEPFPKHFTHTPRPEQFKTQTTTSHATSHFSTRQRASTHMPAQHSAHPALRPLVRWRKKPGKGILALREAQRAHYNVPAARATPHKLPSIA